VTLAPQTDTGGGPFGGGGRDVIQANSSVLTDLSKLGKPGAKFDHTFLLPGTQLTFPQSQASRSPRSAASPPSPPASWRCADGKILSPVSAVA
jgi:hypothetical protein